ncbi:hypothetical protein HOH30_00390, partial [Candidatus Woesearchaeota archaeon]|nr:hypothetical protein [Candidatus Woesearchaeota archaeon]
MVDEGRRKFGKVLSLGLAGLAVGCRPSLREHAPRPRGRDPVVAEFTKRLREEIDITSWNTVYDRPKSRLHEILEDPTYSTTYHTQLGNASVDETVYEVEVVIRSDETIARYTITEFLCDDTEDTSTGKSLCITRSVTDEDANGFNCSVHGCE